MIYAIFLLRAPMVQASTSHQAQLKQAGRANDPAGKSSEEPEGKNSEEEDRERKEYRRRDLNPHTVANIGF